MKRSGVFVGEKAFLGEVFLLVIIVLDFVD